jgi:hypothetical protein
MKEKLKFTLSALMWAVILVAAYGSVLSRPLRHDDIGHASELSDSTGVFQQVRERGR